MKDQEILKLISALSSKYCVNCIHCGVPFNEDPCNTCGNNKRRFTPVFTKSSRWLIDSESGCYECEHCGKISADDTLFCPDCGCYMRG